MESDGKGGEEEVIRLVDWWIGGEGKDCCVC